ncbi:GNAT family N-acetyltransferase [Fictibacillus fluitans]|uniref:GNAT family protein n=1 Tax=Fictibacillus fluitans TaxID=3058422 RepID=A0ABT8I0Y6_9BACL|nr:GNAT family protein [Fictibacillus sp. NE201]MDN4526643.1 GNAT family protein [Fictibacillus sp. NE201]
MQKEFPVIETDRLILRKVTRADTKDMFLYLSDTDVMRYMGLEPYQTPKETETEIRWYDEIFREGTGMRWGITLKGVNKVIGSCGFLNKHPRHRRSEVGFELSKKFWGKGIAGEALDAVVNYGFQELNLERIEALIEPENTASQKLIERKGFQREGLLRHYEFTCGKFDDLYMYSLLRGELE